MTKQAIQLRNISFQTIDQLIIDNISGSFYKGKITTLVGPSGAGKTTLLKLCNGLIAPSSGDIFIDQLPIESYEPSSLRRKVGIALQSAPFLRTSVYENLALPRTLQGQTLSQEEAIAILEDVQLDASFLTRPAHALSGGQKQRLSIARTLINQSEILLLDEITSALDPSATKEIEQLILKINAKYGVTIIWITHNLEQARQVSDEIWVLQTGRLLLSGTPSTLDASDNPTIQQFLKGGLV